MKKIVIASAAMGGAALIAFGASGTFAAFSDGGTTSGSAGAGTLTLSAAKTITTDATALGLAPGETTQLAFPVRNGGTLDGTFTATARVTDATDRCNSATEESEDDCEGRQAGDFSTAASVTAYQFAVADAAACTSTATPPAGSALVGGITLRQLSGQGVHSQTLAGGATTCFVVEVTLPDSGTRNNVVQGDSASLAIDLTLDQVPAVG